MAKRVDKIEIRVRPSTKARIEKLADRADMTISEFMRMLVMIYGDALCARLESHNKDESHDEN